MAALVRRRSRAAQSSGIARWYAVTLIALIVHQIDAAYWQEWEMFRVPGGIQTFLVFNAAAMGLLLFGYRKVLQGESFFRISAGLCGSLGVLVAVLHLGFALAGFDEFDTPLSIATIAVCFVAGLVLLFNTFRRTAAVSESDTES